MFFSDRRLNEQNEGDERKMKLLHCEQNRTEILFIDLSMYSLSSYNIYTRHEKLTGEKSLRVIYIIH